MSNTLNLGDGKWATKEGSLLAYNSENNNYKPLPFTFDRASSATRVNKDGLIETVGADQPRIDYLNDSNGALKLEPSRTNLVTYSEDFSQSDWTKGNSSIESDTLISPSGILNGSTLTDNAANTIHRLRDSLSLSASTDYGLSIFAKKGTLSNIQLALINTANSNTASRVFDLENGALGESITIGGTLQDSKITDYGNGWYRCEITAQLGSTPNTYQITLAPQSSGNSTTGNQVTYDGDGNGNVYLWGAQSEEGSYPTSYIKSNIGSAVTRLADTCSGAGNDQVINSTEGVLYAEISALANDLTERRITISDGTTSNRVAIEYTLSSNQIKGRVVSSSTTSANMNFTASSIVDFSKIAISYKQNEFNLWINGTKVATDTSGSVPIGLNELAFDNGAGNDKFNGNVKDVRVYNTGLTDAELIALTT